MLSNAEHIDVWWPVVLHNRKKSTAFWGSMAKHHKPHLITASFHYLIKTIRNDADLANPIERPFSDQEFQRIVSRVSNTAPLDENNDAVVAQIKSGYDLPFRHHEIVDGHIHFGEFEGAYYGQEYRNNKLGVISADSLNLRKFHYLVTRLRDGKILIGVSYNGQYGDYEGIRSCFTHLLRCNETVTSRTIKNVSDEIGNGEPVEVKLTFRKSSDRPERPSLFGRSGVIAIKAAEYGDGFREEVVRMARKAKGALADRKRSIASLVNDSDMMELDDDDIIACTAVVRENGRTRTVYFLGDNSFATKYPLTAEINSSGNANRSQVMAEMVRIMRHKITPILTA
ncbi:hypothetical protein NKI50_03590 [Mesorhizobium sp. M0563]|uniref:hypothetical protein n=1 Tax=Mesorhizobium sp. M0563 TaxID=2956959 RepID=UPI00333C4B4E